MPPKSFLLTYSITPRRTFVQFPFENGSGGSSADMVYLRLRSGGLILYHSPSSLNWLTSGASVFIRGVNIFNRLNTNGNTVAKRIFLHVST